MLFPIKSYIKFLWHSKNEHGVHSPFVYCLLTKCFYDKRQKPHYQILSNYRNALLKNKDTIKISPFTTGSYFLKSNKKQISEIVKTARISSTRVRLLYRITQYFKPETTLEIGSSLGLATSALYFGNSNASIVTLEDCSAAASLAKIQLRKFNCDTVNSIVDKFNSQQEIPNLKYLKDSFSEFEPEIYNLIYFNGRQSKKDRLDYFEFLLPTIMNETVWIFEGIHQSLDSEQAWEIIKAHPKITVSIDTFQWGLAFFRSEQHKEHFVIRI